MNRHWVLGAADPEMTAIEGLLQMCGEYVWYATCEGRRVHPGNAYKADPSIAGMYSADIEGAVWVECAPSGALATIDHHRPGDPGHGVGPKDFLRGSSLGQVLMILAGRQGSEKTALGGWPRPSARLGARPEAGKLVYEESWFLAVAGERREGYRGDYGGVYARWVRVPEHLVLTAAADHCLGAAYAGQCPGVEPERLKDYRSAARADWLQGLPHDRPERVAVESHVLDGTWQDAVLKVYGATLATLVDAPRVMLGDYEVLDITGRGTLPELPEVLAQSGQCALYTRENYRDGTTKVGILGAGEGTLAGVGPVEEFIARAREGSVAGHSVDPGSVYGAPVRGYAGATLAD